MSTTVQPDADVHISRVDQSKINQFARMNARVEDLKDQLKTKENDLRNIEDASDEITLNVDETESIPYSFGEIFIKCSQEEALALLERDKGKLDKELAQIRAEVGNLQEGMSELKTHLYAKFGDNINLEADADDDD